MNRRLRSPCSRSSQSSEAMVTQQERFQRYLKPGALARIRDSKINARQKPRLAKNPCVSLRLLSIQNDHQVQNNPIEAIPCFSVRVFGPRFPQRKKMHASKSVIVSVMNSNPSSPTASLFAENRSDPLVDMFTISDLVVVH